MGQSGSFLPTSMTRAIKKAMALVALYPPEVNQMITTHMLRMIRAFFPSSPRALINQLSESAPEK